MSRTPIFAANWKMYKTVPETADYLEAFCQKIADINDREVIIAPPFTALHVAVEAVKGTDLVKISAQNMYFEDQGPFTGEISPLMLKDLGVTHCILGHSERRHIFGETSDLVGKKVVSAISHSITPILCIGETLMEREAGKTEEVVVSQLDSGLNDIDISAVSDIIIAYEPVWAIGTGKTATPDLAQTVHAVIRQWIVQKFNSHVAEKVRILYGGSVKPDNIRGLMAQPDIDGVLVGGASLHVASFEKIVRFEEG